MKTTRRDFLRTSGGAVLGAGMLGALPSLAFGDEKKKEGGARPTLVSIYLRGGADPLQTIVPWSDPLYHQVRPTIGIQAQDTKDEKGVLKLNNYFGLHPAMEPIHGLFQKGFVAPIVNVGSHHPTRSHFDAQDFMEYAAPGIRTITEGWLNRFLSKTAKKTDGELRAIAMQPLLPRALRGEYQVLAVPGFDSDTALNTFEKLYACDEDMAMEKAMSKKEAEMAKLPGSKGEREARASIIASGKTTIKTLRRLKEITSASGSTQVNYPGTPFGRQMQALGRIIRADVGLEIAGLDYRGWDHHARQGGAEGQMARMLGDVSASLSAFAQDLGPRFDRTLVLIMSEFGRTVRENGNNGTDHGHGGFMLALGGMVAGKRIYGTWKGLEPKNLWEGRDMPIYTDFRTVFAETLTKLFKFDAYNNNFFPEFRGEPQLGFLKQI